MSPLAGPFFAFALLLGAAGAMKVARPDATRVALRSVGLPASTLVARGLGGVEIGVALAALWWTVPVTVLAVGAFYLGFAGFSEVLMLRTARRGGCGCFGASDAPVGRLHVLVNLVGVGVAVALAVGATSLERYGEFVSATPANGVPFALGTVVLMWLLKALLTDVPELLATLRAEPRARTTQADR